MPLAPVPFSPVRLRKCAAHHLAHSRTHKLTCLLNHASLPHPPSHSAAQSPIANECCMSTSGRPDNNLTQMGTLFPRRKATIRTAFPCSTRNISRFVPLACASLAAEATQRRTTARRARSRRSEPVADLRCRRACKISKHRKCVGEGVNCTSEPGRKRRKAWGGGARQPTRAIPPVAYIFAGTMQSLSTEREARFVSIVVNLRGIRFGFGLSHWSCSCFPVAAS